MRLQQNCSKLFRVLAQAFPGNLSHAVLSVLEAWLSTVLNTVAGGLFVIGSYTILAGMYHDSAPQRVLFGPHVRTLNFWGSAAYLVVRPCPGLTHPIFAKVTLELSYACTSLSCRRP